MKKLVLVILSLLTFVLCSSLADASGLMQKTIRYAGEELTIKLYNGKECEIAKVTIQTSGTTKSSYFSIEVQWDTPSGYHREKKFSAHPGERYMYEVCICMEGDNLKPGSGSLRILCGGDEVFFTEFSFDGKYIKFGESYKSDPNIDIDIKNEVNVTSPSETRPPERQPKDTQSSAVFNIKSNPADADLYIDGNFVGNTPATVELTFGQHKIVVKKKGCKDWKKDLNVGMKGTFSLNAELEKMSEEEIAHRGIAYRKAEWSWESPFDYFLNVQYSDDGINWYDVLSKCNHVRFREEMKQQYMAWDDVGAHRYWSLCVCGIGGTPPLKIWEMNWFTHDGADYVENTPTADMISSRASLAVFDASKLVDGDINTLGLQRNEPGTSAIRLFVIDTQSGPSREAAKTKPKEKIATGEDLTSSFQWIKSYVLEDGVKNGIAFGEKRRGIVVLDKTEGKEHGFTAGWFIWMEVEEVPFLKEKERCWITLSIIHYSEDELDSVGTSIGFDPLQQKYFMSEWSVGSKGPLAGKTIEYGMTSKKADDEVYDWLTIFGYIKIQKRGN